jgi:hypothetical protein
MPISRQADLHLGGLGGSFFLDFNLTTDKRISLYRMSFDGYGCCDLTENVNLLDFEKSNLFVDELAKVEIGQKQLTRFIL